MAVSVDYLKTAKGASPILLGASGVAASVTGTLSETALATVSVPAMKADGCLLVVSAWTITNSANTKNLRGRLGGISGSAFLAGGFTTLALVSDMRRIRNRGATNSQVVSANIAAPVGGLGGTTSAITTMAVDVSTAQDLVFTGQLTNIGETITLEMYEVWLLP